MGCLVLAGIVVVLSIVGTCGGGSGGGGGDADKNPKQEQAAQQGDQEAQKEIEKAQQQAAEAEKEAKEAKEAQEAAEQAREEAEKEQQAEEERKAAEEQQRREEAAAARKKAAEAAAATAKIGETVRAGDAEWTVTYAWRTNVLRQKGFGQFGDSKQGNFVVMDFRFTNRASESVTLDSISLPLFDSQGREYEADTDTFGYIPAEKDIFLNQVNPSVTQEGRIIYSVAPDAQGFTVHAGDLSLFGDEEAKIALGF